MNNVQKFINEIKVYDTDLTKIRIGDGSDGGYVAAKELCESSPKAISVGVGDDVSFEIDFLDRFSPEEILLFDPTINNLPKNRSRFTFYKSKFFDNQAEIPVNSTLKVDIEWDEWELFHSMPVEELKKFSQILVEFHIIHAPTPGGLSPYFTGVYDRAIESINDGIFNRYQSILNYLSEFFYIFHVHANNSLPPITINQHSFPPLIEVSFVRNDLVDRKSESKESFPVDSLDFPNKTDRPDIIGWYPIC